jgi:hypothetical protein
MRKTLKFTLAAVLVVAISLTFGIAVFAAGSFDDVKIDYATQTIVGIEPGFQYKVNTGNYQNAYGNIDISSYAADASFTIRNAAGEESGALTIAAQPAAPGNDTKYVAEDEEIVVEDDGAEYKINAFAWTSVTDEAINTKYISDNITAPVQVRFAATDSAPASAIKTIVVPKRAAAPATVAYDPNSDIITGVLSTMEYTVADATGAPSDAWESISTTAIDRDKLETDFSDEYDAEEATIVYVRIKAAGTQPASHPAEIEFPKEPETPTIGDISEYLSIDYVGEKFVVDGDAPLLEYSATGNSPWTALTNGASLSSLIPAYTDGSTPATIKVRIKAAPPNYASDPEDFPIPERPETPDSETFTFDTSAESINSIDTGYQYAVGATGEFVNYADNDDATAAFAPGTADKTVYIRSAASNEDDKEAFASAPIAVTIPKRPAAPSLSYNASTDTVKGTAGLSYQYTTGLEVMFADFEPADNTAITRDELGLDTEAASVYIRLAPNEDGVTPASAYRKIDFPAQGESSTGVMLNYAEEKLEGATKTTMEYRKSSSAKKEADDTYTFTYPTSWTTVNANDMSVTSMIPAATAVAPVGLQIRIKAQTGTAASETEEFTLNPRPATPVKTTDVAFNGGTEKIEFVSTVEDKGYEYLIGSSGDYTAIDWADEDYTFDASPEVGSAATSVKIRIAASDDNGTFASLVLSLSVPARPAAPSAAYSGTTDSITGLSASTSEYSLTGADDGPWVSTNITSTMSREKFSKDIPDYDGEAFSVYVRKKATATAPHSAAVKVDVPALATDNAPDVTLDVVEEKIMGTTNKMEYTKDDGKTWTSASNTSTNIVSIISSISKGETLTVKVRVKATPTDPASAAKEIVLKARPDTPTATQVKYNFTDEKIVITGGLSGLEYSTGGDYIDVVGDEIEMPATTAAQSVKVRVKAVADDTPASLIRTISVPKRSAAPSAAWDATNGRIKSVTSAMEYSTDGGSSWLPVPSGKTYIEDENFFPGIEVLVRVKATASAVHSAEKSITVPATA